MDLNVTAWLLPAQTRLYELEAQSDSIRAQLKAIENERFEISEQIIFNRNEISRFEFSNTRSKNPADHARNEQGIVNCNARIASLNSRMASANARYENLKDSSRPFTQLLEGCRKAMNACTPAVI